MVDRERAAVIRNTTVAASQKARGTEGARGGCQNSPEHQHCDATVWLSKRWRARFGFRNCWVQQPSLKLNTNLAVEISSIYTAYDTKRGVKTLPLSLDTRYDGVANIFHELPLPERGAPNASIWKLVYCVQHLRRAWRPSPDELPATSRCRCSQ